MWEYGKCVHHADTPFTRTKYQEALCMAFHFDIDDDDTKGQT